MKNRLLVVFLSIMFSMVNMPALVLAQGNDSTPSELAQQGVSLKTSFQTSEKGVFTNTTDLTRPDGYAAVLDNLHQTKDGVWTDKGYGWELQNEDAFGSTFVEISEQITRHRGETIVMQVDDKVYSYDGTTKTDITGDAVPAVGHIPCIRTFQNGGGNYYIFCNDLGEPTWGYDTAGPLYLPPVLGGPFPAPMSGFPVVLGGKTYSKPPFCEGYYGRVVYAGFADHPHSLLLSSPLDGNYFAGGVTPTDTDAGVIECPPQLGDITGMCPLRVGNGSNDQTLLIGCTKGVGILTGTGANTFACKELTRSYGIPNNRTWAPLGDNILFCATDGIRRIANSAYGANVVGTPISYPVQDLYQRINTAAMDQMWAVNNRSTQEIEFWIPIDSNTTCKNVIVANYRTSTGQDLIFSTKSGVSGSCGIYITASTVGATSYQGMWIGGYDGYLQNWHGITDDGASLSGPLDYGGTPIHWRYVSNIIGANSFAQNSSMRKFLIICDGGAQKFVITAFVYTTNSDGTTRRLGLAPKAINYENYVVPDLSTWNESIAFTHVHPALFDYAPLGSGRLWFNQIEGNPEGTSGDTINLVGIQPIQTIGGLKQ